MDIILCDINYKICREWENMFKDDKYIKIICADYINTAKNKNVDCLVSPGNSVGIMDGGLGLHIRNLYMDNQIDIQTKVQECIIEKYRGQQPTGTSLFIGNDFMNLINTPTMRFTKKVSDLDCIYFSMRSSILCALENKVETLLVPAFGAGAGGVHPTIVARIMRDALYSLEYQEFHNWDVVDKMLLGEF